MVRLYRHTRSPFHQAVLLKTYYSDKHKLGLNSHINTILSMFSAVGIDILRVKKPFGIQRLKIVFQILYRWLMCSLMFYFFTARLYKAAQPNVPLMLSFSETTATASSIFLRFVVLGKRQAINKLLRYLQSVQAEDDINPSASYVRREKLFFAFSILGFLLTMTLSTMKALSELMTPQGFQLYRKSYLFSASFSNDTTLYKITNGFVFVSHLTFIFNLYAVPSLCLLLCCLVCNGIGFFNLQFQTKLSDNPNYPEWNNSFIKICIFHLRRMHTLSSRAERALSTVLFFLYSYLLCSLFFIVSLTIRKSRGQDEIRQTYIVAAFLNLILFYIVLTVSVARVRETVSQVRSYILQKAGGLTPRETATLFVNARELTRDIQLTGWGVFTIDRNFLLASAGMVVSYGVILAQLSA